MGDRSSIEWTDATWNPTVGCSLASPGCTNCYAMRTAHRMAAKLGVGKYSGLTKVVNGNPVWTGELRVHWGALDQPLNWTKPRRIFVNSMSDLFHPMLDMVDVAMIYGTAIAAVHLRKHTIQILTKRSDRMREVLHDEVFWDVANAHAESIVLEKVDPLNRRSDDARATLEDYDQDKPPPGIWLGVSTEDQVRADERVPDLLATPAAKRFVSAEPLLGVIDFNRLRREPSEYDRAMPGFAGVGKFVTSALEGVPGLIMADDGREYWEGPDSALRGPRLDWVIAGGESGPRARPMHPAWIRGLRDQCRDAGVPFFFKQWGEWRHDLGTVKAIIPPSVERRYIEFDGVYMERVGKKKAGALLDGVEHREMPHV